ncbi:alpha/beta hydrolase [Streptomyces sp. NPDC005551]|uniref:alpha/beta hydrolase n=1 Tax=unclassified Streptomyces TaxID=2593676 RepID=UPI0033D8B482
MTLTPPPFDKELAVALTEFVPLPFTPDMVRASRETGAAFRPTDETLSRDGAFSVEDRRVPGPPGAPDVSLLVCRPTGAEVPLPVVYFVHGGGMVTGDNRVGVDAPLSWAEELGLVVVSVEYRLAPENPHPAPVDDCYAGLEWTSRNARLIGGDAGRLVVAGQSSGGGLAAALALRARDEKGPRLAGQLLMCPMLDDRNDSYSARQMAGHGMWDRTSNDTGWTALLGDRRGSDDVCAYAAPARATDLSGLPPAFIDVGSAETFRDEDIAYADAIWRAGGEAELHVWPGGFHGFDALAPEAALSRAARAARTAWLRRLLGC